MASRPPPLLSPLLLAAVLLGSACSASSPSHQRALLGAPVAEAPAAALEPPEGAAAAQAAESSGSFDSGGCFANAALLEPAVNATNQAMAALGTVCTQGSAQQCSEGVALGTPGLSTVWATLFLLTGAEALVSGERGDVEHAAQLPAQAGSANEPDASTTLPCSAPCAYQSQEAVGLLTAAFDAGLATSCAGPGANWGAASSSLSSLLSSVAEAVPTTLLQHDLGAAEGFEAAVADLAGAGGQAQPGAHTSSNESSGTSSGQATERVSRSRWPPNALASVLQATIHNLCLPPCRRYQPGAARRPVERPGRLRSSWRDP